MAELPASWHPPAAYLYTLQLDGPALAWEYLRRHPDYVREWRAHRRGSEVDPRRWGLEQFEDPAADARDAQPVWCFDSHALVQLHPSLAPSERAVWFRLWQLPGHKRLVHDGHRVRLMVQFATCILHLLLAPGIGDGTPIVGAVPIDEARSLEWRGVECTLTIPNRSNEHGASIATRPNRSQLTHMRSLQAVDGVRAGASLRQVAVALFGANAVKSRWHADSELRAQVRYLVRRGRSRVHGGYRRLLQPGRVRERRHPPSDDAP